MSFTTADHQYMNRALRLARRGMYTTDPNPNVGCVLVSPAGETVGEGWHERAGQPHAEPLALEQAGAAAAGATAYVTLEPCSHHGRTPPCAEQLVTAGITRVVYAMEDPNPIVSGAGAQRIRDAGIEVLGGLMQQEAETLNRGYSQRMRHGRPWVTAKLAVSIDGRTALANGTSKWITSEAARADVHRLRARSSAILCGSGTVLADDPQLTARCAGVADVVQPLRVVADSHLRTPLEATVVQDGGGLLLVHASADESAVQAAETAGVTVQSLPGKDGRVDLDALLQALGDLEINDVLVEAGPGLNGALLDAGLLDELIVYQAPRIMGAAAQGMFAGRTVTDMESTGGWQIAEARRTGDDLRVTYRKA